MGSLGWSFAEFIINCMLYIFNAVLFTVFLIKIFKSKEDRKFVQANKWTIVTLLCMIIVAVLQPLGLYGLIIDFPSWCHQTGCNQCTILGICRDFFFRLGTLGRCFMIIKVLELNIQPYPTFLLLFPKKLIVWIKILLLFGFILASMLGMVVFQFKYQIYPINTDANAQHICVHSIDGNIPVTKKMMFGFFGALVVAIHILFCYLVIKQTIKVYEGTRRQLIVADYNKTKQNIYLILNGLIIPGIRQSILVCIMALTLCIWAIIHIAGITNSVADPLANSIIGMMCIMMLPVGKSCFDAVFRPIERRIVTKWINLKIVSIHNSRKSSISEQRSSSKEVSSPKSIIQKSGSTKMGVLPQIEILARKDTSSIQEDIMGNINIDSIDIDEENISNLIFSKLSSLSPVVMEEMNSKTGTYGKSRFESPSGTASNILEARMAYLEDTHSRTASYNITPFSRH